jgi:hypothetical protein
VGLGSTPFLSPYLCAMGKPIYYMKGKATFIKNKHPQTRSVWIVSTYDNPRDIMKHDTHTMYRLDQELLTPKAKQRTIIIDKVEDIKQIGTTVDVKQTQR